MALVLRRAYNWLNRWTGVRRNVNCASDVTIGAGSYITAPSGLTIGRGTKIGRQCFIAVDGHIGCGVLLSTQVGLVGRHDHALGEIGTWIADAPWVFDAGYELDATHSVSIGDDVWIGFGAIVVSGVTIGRGAIVGAGAVVTSSVAPYAIVAGSPARQIGTRFSPEEIERHETALLTRYGPSAG